MSQTALITGANSGIGLHTLKRLYATGHYAKIIGIARDPQKCNLALEALSSITAPAGETTVEFYTCDLTSSSQIQKLYDEDLKGVSSIDLIVNNAGVMDHPLAFTDHGIEIHFAANYLGHFQLTKLLLNKLSHDARIINVTSGHYKKTNKLPVLETVKIVDGKKPRGSPKFFYAQSKLSQNLYTLALKHFLENNGRGSVKVVSVRPGFIRGTELGRYHSKFIRTISIPLILLFSKNLEKGTDGIVFCATAPSGDVQSGKLYFNKNVEEYNRLVTDENAKNLWDLSEKLLAI